MTAFQRRAQPRVTILIPCFNAASYVRDAINCALGQTYSHIEIIVAPDDGDTYRHLREEFTSTRLRIMAPGQTVGTGAGAARNRAIDAASGEFFTILDADDLIPPNYVETLMAVALSDGAAVAPLRYTNWEGANVRTPPLPPGCLTLSGFGQLLASAHPLVHRSLEHGYCSGFAEDVIHDGIIIARLGSVQVVAGCSYDARIRNGSACVGQVSEAMILAAYAERVAQLVSRPTEIGAQCLSPQERDEFANLFRFRALVSGAFAASGWTCYHSWVAGREAYLWDQFTALKAESGTWMLDEDAASRIARQRSQMLVVPNEVADLTVPVA